MNDETVLERDAVVIREHDAREVAVHVLALGRAAVFSMRSPGKATPNEDVAALIPCRGGAAFVLAVADGLGGLRGGSQASAAAIGALRATIDGQGGDAATPLRSAVISGIEAANRAVQNLGLGAATTLALVTVEDGHVRPFHVGDSDVLVIGQRGKVKLETVSHSPVGFALEAGLLNEREAMRHKDRHIVSNVIGSPEMRIEVGSTLKLAPRDIVLLASDGLRDNLRLDEIVARVRKGPLKAAAERLAEDCARRMLDFQSDEPSKPDDLTFILFRSATRDSAASARAGGG